MIIIRQGDIVRPPECNFHSTDAKKEVPVNENADQPGRVRLIS
jgi:hypothetical protein